MTALYSVFVFLCTVALMHGGAEAVVKRAAQPDAPSGSKLPYQLAAEALYAASNATSYFHMVFGPAIPWKTLAQVDQPGGEFSPQNADLLGKIKTTLLNGIDAYDSASQSVYEWSSYGPNTLQRYIQLFEASDPASVNLQTNLLVRVLENGFKKLGNGQKQFGNILSAFNAASNDLQKLVAQLKVDYSENSPYFQNRVKKIIAAESGGWFGPKPDKAKIIAQLKAKFQPILEFYVNFSAQIEKVVGVLSKTSPQIGEVIQVLGERQSQIEAASHGEAQADTPEHRDAAIQAAQVLIAVCQDYHKAHA